MALAAGYACRRGGLVAEERSKAISFHTIVWLWSSVSVLSVWRLPMQWVNLWLLLIQPIIMVTACVAMMPVARWLKLSRDHTGVLAISASQGNLGFTLGGYLCYALLSPGDVALAYAVAIVSIMQAAAVLLIFPIARRFGPHDDRDEPLGKLMLKSLFELRGMHLYAAVAGLLLALSGLPVPTWIDTWRVKDILFYAGSIGAYFGIGLRLRVGLAESLSCWREHLALAAGKFVFIPLITLLLLAIMRATPWVIEPLGQKVILVEAFMPTAIAAVLYANMFHLDARRASVIWFWNTVLFAIVILPVLIFVL
jgi:predicted permease